jgi:hypothetical protein
MLVACNEGPAYLDQSEENLGLREAWYGTDHWVFHAAPLYPYGLGLRTRRQSGRTISGRW